MKNNTITQSGRSMIEMLGVLAIVGVLSVGGIAGYSKAMQKYRTNKTIEQVTQIINGVRTLYSQQKNYEGLDYDNWEVGVRLLKKAKILPESAFEGNDAKNPFGGNYYIVSSGIRNWNDNKAASLALTDIPDDACIELLTQDWGAGEGLIAVGWNDSYIVGGCSGKKESGAILGCADDSTLPISMDDAVSVCDSNNAWSHDLYFIFQ